MAGKVRAMLGCMHSELDRWDADGRLSHLDDGEESVSGTVTGVWLG
jgi:hypothetical protein